MSKLRKTSNKSTFFVLLTIFMGLVTSSPTLLGMKSYDGKGMSVEKFSELYADKIAKGEYGIEELNNLKGTLFYTEIGQDPVNNATKKSLFELINKKILIKSRELKEKVQLKEVLEESLREQAKKTVSEGPSTGPTVTLLDGYGERSDVRVGVLLDWARKNKVLMGQKKFVVNGITNNFYQLKVDEQNDGLTCGPRALFNNYTLSRYFLKKNKDKERGLQMLDKLINKLRVKSVVLPVQEFLGEIKKIVGTDQNLHSQDLEKVIKEYKKNDKYKDWLMIQNVSTIDGYEFLATKQLVGTMDIGYAEVEKIENLNIEGVGIVPLAEGRSYKRGVGYYQGFVITEGENERQEEGYKSGGHFFSLFGIKTGNNQYSWFVMDSLNPSYFDWEREIKIKAYINRLLGNDTFPEYDKTIEEFKSKKK